jgi:hypothetical protein
MVILTSPQGTTKERPMTTTNTTATKTLAPKLSASMASALAWAASGGRNAGRNDAPSIATMRGLHQRGLLILVELSPAPGAANVWHVQRLTEEGAAIVRMGTILGALATSIALAAHRPQLRHLAECTVQNQLESAQDGQNDRPSRSACVSELRFHLETPGEYQIPAAVAEAWLEMDLGRAIDHALANTADGVELAAMIAAERSAQMTRALTAAMYESGAWVQALGEAMQRFAMAAWVREVTEASDATAAEMAARAASVCTLCHGSGVYETPAGTTHCPRHCASPAARAEMDAELAVMALDVDDEPHAVPVGDVDAARADREAVVHARAVGRACVAFGEAVWRFVAQCNADRVFGFVPKASTWRPWDAYGVDESELLEVLESAYREELADQCTAPIGAGFVLRAVRPCPAVRRACSRMVFHWQTSTSISGLVPCREAPRRAPGRAFATVPRRQRQRAA